MQRVKMNKSRLHYSNFVYLIIRKMFADMEYVVQFLGERYYATSAFMSSVTLLRLAQRVKHFGNIFASSNSLGTWAVCIKILGKN